MGKNAVVSQSDLKRDSTIINSWWKSQAEQLPISVAGLWFGITNLAAGGRPARTLYVAGCPAFEANDPTAEWATDYCWWPDDRYVNLPDLAAFRDSQQSEILVHGAALVRTLTATLPTHIEGLAVGFDSGDFRLIPTRGVQR